ncbi:CorA family divalent cation transporter [Sphingobacterium sp. GVS05A]|uniref:CorA family divalent cation transporter n=1 Tax=Sphingobacterium sp. GVS05A TaxID=2862679 RepID=UPI001CBA92FB|nr:CorA family divalent cation transporter [Sphingobacterium sp. GVS05A]
MKTIDQHRTQFDNFVWIDICQPDKESLNKIAEEYQLDYFQIKDSLEPGHLPKFESQPNYNFLILRAFTSTIEKGATTINELSNKIAFFYNGHKLITIHRSQFAFLDTVKQKYETSEELLVYLIYKMVETYQIPLDTLDEKIIEIEQTIFLKDYARVSLKDLYFLKAQTRITKKLLQIFQNVTHQIEVAENNKTALQDIKDKLLNLILSYDEVIENANNLLTTYHSVNAQKSNDVMKLLTIFSAFFLPLTFLAGIYGMNFENMPELKWRFGYFITLGVMAIISIIIYLWFKRRRII